MKKHNLNPRVRTFTDLKNNYIDQVPLDDLSDIKPTKIEIDAIIRYQLRYSINYI